MLEHIRINHQNVRRVCHICAKELKTLSGLNDHLLEHNSLDTPKIKCKFCSHTFKTLPRLRRHMRYHHEKLATDLQCPHCPKKMPNKYLLRGHIAGIHNYKRHICHLCKREFRTPGLLKVRILDKTTYFV